MQRIPLTGAWQDVCALSGIPVGTPVRVTCTGLYTVLIQAQQAAPTPSFVGEVGLPLRPGDSLTVGTGEPGLWVFGQGAVEVTRVAPDADANDGLWDGRQFRMDYRYSIAQGGTATLRFTAPCDFILKSQRCAGTYGDIKVDAYAGSTSTGSYSAVSPRGLNLTTRRPTPLHTAQVSLAVATDAVISGGAVVETFDCYAGTASRITSTVSNAVDWRVLPAGTYHLRLQGMSNGNSTGVFSLMWEEIP